MNAGPLSALAVDMLFGSPRQDHHAHRRRRPARATARLFAVPTTHAVLGTPLEGPWPDGTEVLYVAMGCFWGVERIFWKLPGVVTTAAGYQGGYTRTPPTRRPAPVAPATPRPCWSPTTPTVTSPELLLKAFWENHDPTTGNRQGNDIGTAYRSAIFWTTPGQEAAARTTRAAFQDVLHRAGRGEITTQLGPGRARPVRSTTPRTTTSSTCTRTPAATATTARTG